MSINLLFFLLLSHSLDYDEFVAALQSLHPSSVDIWRKMLGASVLDLKPTHRDLNLDKIKMVLATRGGDWTDRIDAMHSFCKHAVQPMSKKKFDSMMRPIREHLIEHLSDRRSGNSKKKESPTSSIFSLFSR